MEVVWIAAIAVIQNWAVPDGGEYFTVSRQDMENSGSCIAVSWLTSTSVVFCIAVYAINTLVYMNSVVTI